MGGLNAPCDDRREMRKLLDGRTGKVNEMQSHDQDIMSAPSHEQMLENLAA